MPRFFFNFFLLAEFCYKMFDKSTENFLVRASQALVRPVQNRCAELAVLFDRANIKDLHSFFPVLIDSIFGPHSTVCWQLRTFTSTTHSQDFQALQHFFSPLGPMFKLIYTLLKDPIVKYKFSLNLLPYKVQQNLNNSTMHPFYADLLNLDPQTNRVISLMLNAFDYYFFHFAYHLINPFHQHTHYLRDASWSTVYYVLCCDYVLHFLPTNPSTPVLPILSFYNGKNPIYTLPSFNKPIRSSKLFRSNTLNVSKSQTLEHHPRNKIWRSETIITVFIDMWLNNDQILMDSQIFDKNFEIMSPCKPKITMNEIPTGEYIRIVRILVKQLHAFSSSSKADDTHMGELKKIVIPYLQGKMYTFLRHLIYRWPLDGSFRLVLELWVSFLQPWRYPGDDYLKPINQPETISELEETNPAAPMKAVEGDHVQFIAENLLTYTVILQQLLPRFAKVDLSSPKIALLLYRLTKVFSQPNLVPYLRQIESDVEYISNSPVHLCNFIHSNGLPPLSPTSNWSTNVISHIDSSHSKYLNHSRSFDNSYRETSGRWTNVIKQKIFEYENLNFCYKPIFCALPAPEVYDLLRHIKQAEETAQFIVQCRLNVINQKTKGFLGHLKQWFLISENSNDEFTLDERKRVPVYLQMSLKNLIDTFNITETEFIKHQKSFNESQNSVQFNNDINSLLTPERVRERVKTIKYEGDPDLHPIKSDESKFLVRLFYQLATKINTDFRFQIDNFYLENNFTGSLARQLLSPPITIYKYEKSQAGRSPRVQQHLPPRFSFRRCASYKFIFYFTLMVVLSKLLGYGYFAFIFICSLFRFTYVCLKAFCSNYDNHRTPLQPPSNSFVDISDNVSFNESF